MPREDTPGVKSLFRALSLLEILASNGSHRSLGDIAHAAKMPPSTTHRLLRSLQQMGYVVQNQVTSEYALGDALISLGRKAEQQRDLRDLARPWMEKLARATDETVNLTALVNDGVVQMEHVDSRNILKVTYDFDQVFPVHASASGKVFLAYLPATERERMLRRSGRQTFTKRTIVDTAALRAELDAIRSRGYALDDAEREEGVRCIAAPIFDAGGAAVAAVSVSGPSLRLSLTKLHELAESVVATASAISVSLGYEPRNDDCRGEQAQAK